MQTIGVNIVPGNFPQFIRYSQNDIGREFKINVVDFEIPSGATVECVATKPSGLGFTVSGTVTGNTVTFVTTAIMTDEWGKFPAELRITSGGEVLGTANFMFIGERNPHPEGTTDGQQGTIIPELTLLVNEIRESNARVAEMTASAHASNEPTAEYDADTNNLEFGIPSITEEEFLKAFVTDSASGSIASITDGADDVPVKSLSVNIAPKQSGSGDPSPSNVRPITGWDEVEVVRTGKNLLDPAYRYNQPATSGSHIRFYWAGAGTDYYTKLLVKKGVTYTLSYDGSIAGGIYIKKGTSAQTQTNIFTAFNTNHITFTPTEDFYCAIDIYWGTAPTGGVESINPILSAGTTATTYEPYQGTSYPISLPSTVYGGTLDVVSGVLTLTKGFVDLGSLSWANSGSYFASEITLNYNDTSQWTVPNGLCDRYKIVAMYYVTNAGARVDKSISWYPNLIRIVDSSYTDVTAFKNSLNGAQMVYEFANPTTVQLTPTEVTTLLGNNNIYSDAGSVEVEYRADTKLYIDKLLGNTRTLSMAMAPTNTETDETPTEEEQR